MFGFLLVCALTASNQDCTAAHNYARLNGPGVYESSMACFRNMAFIMNMAHLAENRDAKAPGRYRMVIQCGDARL